MAYLSQSHLDAIDHCVWARKSGLSPLDVLLSVGGVVLPGDAVTWSEAVAELRHAALRGTRERIAA